MKQYGLSEFNQLIKSILEDNLEMSYWIVAEIGDINVHSRGHCYLELVEKDNNFLKAKLRATIWSYTFSQVHAQFVKATGSPLESGMKILVNGSLQFHELYGLSFNINDIDPNYTLGERERKKEETILRLKNEGLIDQNTQIQLPLVPQNIAVISSETAAGYGDFMDQLRSNEWGYQINTRLFPATMQGEQAARSIIDVLQNIDTTFDMAVLIRGGGAKTDLDCFDEYELCAEIAAMKIPVVTGIGHERDETIADMVAHSNLKTPTAVAEFIISGMLNFENQVVQLMDQVSKTAKNTISENLLRVQHMETLIKQLPHNILEKEQLQIQLFEKVIQGSDPKFIMEKGFSITRVNGQAIKSGIVVKEGDEIVTQTAEQTITSKVNKTQ